MLLSSERISVTEQAASDSAASDAGEIPRISPFSASDWVGSFSASVRVGPFSATGKYDSLKVGSCELCASEIDPVLANLRRRKVFHQLQTLIWSLTFPP